MREVITTAVISSAVVAALINGYFAIIKTQAETEQKNVELAVAMSKGEEIKFPDRSAIYAALMVKGNKIDADIGCGLVGIALFTGQARPNHFNTVRSTLGKAFVDQYLAEPPCDVAHYKEEGEVQGQDATPAPTVSCPTGRLFTQFGDATQRDFGIALRERINDAAFGGFAEVPEVIPEFTAKNVVVRYFFREAEPVAARWHDLLEKMIPHLDVKYAYIGGYEAAFGAEQKNTFELWWPSGIAVPAPPEKASCEMPAAA